MDASKLKHYSIGTYRKLTAKTVGGAAWTLVGLILFIMFFATFALGVFSGADAAMDGDALRTAEVIDVETEVWADFSESSSIGRAFYGLFHWVVAVSVWLAVLGMHIGYAAPMVAYPFSWVAEPVPYIVLALAALQLIRLGELAYLDGKERGWPWS